MVACVLQRQLLTFTTLPGNPLLASMRASGIPDTQIRFRDPAAAHAAGDGSGWFRDPVTGKGYATVSIEYGRGAQRLEIAEMDTSQTVFGLERVAWARSGVIGTWSDTLPRLLAHTRALCAATSSPLPSGYNAFRATQV
jgi:hypothetical protein